MRTSTTALRDGATHGGSSPGRAATRRTAVRTPATVRTPAAVFARTAALAGAVAVLAACGGSASVDGRTFVSTAAVGHDLVSGTSVLLTFEDGAIAAEAGCNTMISGYAWSDGVLEVDDLASTRMGCPDDLAAQDAWLTALLTSDPAMVLDGDTLRLGDAENGLTLTASS